MMEVTRSLLDEVAGAIATAAGLPLDAVALYENQDGSFTANVAGAEFTGSLRQVIAWAAQEAREAVERLLENDDELDGPGSSYHP